MPDQHILHDDSLHLLWFGLLKTTWTTSNHPEYCPLYAHMYAKLEIAAPHDQCFNPPDDDDDDDFKPSS